MVFRDVEAPSPTIVNKLTLRTPSPTAVKQLFEILTALAFPSGEGGPLAVEEVCRKIKIPMVFRDVEAPSPTKKKLHEENNARPSEIFGRAG